MKGPAGGNNGWDWQVFCKNTTEGTIEPGCWAKGPTSPTCSGCSGLGLDAVGCVCWRWIVALVLGSLVGIIRTLPDSPWLVRLGNAWVELFRNIPSWCSCSSGTS
jgi:glutamate/aspartate transport system permease protein